MLLCLTESRFIVHHDGFFPPVSYRHVPGKQAPCDFWQFSVRHRETGKIYAEGLTMSKASQLRFRLARQYEDSDPIRSNSCDAPE